MSGTTDSIAADELDAFIDRWAASGGSERANLQPFVVELCQVLGLPRPDPSKEQNQYNDYVFERTVAFKHADGSETVGSIDLYRRGCFVMEGKQSAKRIAAARAHDALPEDARRIKAGTARRGTRGWDSAMLAARRQAEDYARALPVEHGYPPLLLVVDVGHVVEVYADFSGQGKNYAHFPDRNSYRIGLDDLRDPDIRERLRAAWLDPQSLDPARISAEVTRDVAERLARIARKLEARHDAKDVAEFLMRCLFTMFSEDVGLLPADSFRNLLGELRERPDQFPPAVEHFWRCMESGGFEPRSMATFKRFNGTLFKTRTALALDADDIEELWIAAGRDWGDVEPAIFGTLLERALDPKERSMLGAHYTPRAYVERLVVPTVIEPLRRDWEEVEARAQELQAAGDTAKALAAVKAFHHRLCTTRVLDPACGTGNFLYVALELMKRLEGDVLEALESLGEAQARLTMQGETVDPSQFFGLELNPRAVAIADLVLWLGYLKWQLRTADPDTIQEPVLHAYGTIRHADAILAWDEREMARDERGAPITVWDGRSMKPHAVTGRPAPDTERRIETWVYTKPRPAQWPEVEFVVGNPPFIGGKDIRAELGDGYAEAIRAARPHLPGGADFVMHFWDQAATVLLAKGSRLRRFGFITTNSITQTFSRRVIERHMAAKRRLSLVFAVPDHPWLKSADKAAVRIAMTVAEAGDSDGVLAKAVAEAGLNTDTPTVRLARQIGRVLATLRLGADLSRAKSLMANAAISSRGVSLHGSGFIVTPAEARTLGLGTVPGLEQHILPYRNGRDLAKRPRGVMVIDLFPLDIADVRARFPAVYQHLHDRVKPERDVNNRPAYRDNWWIFGEPRSDLRPALDGLDRYIATVETSKHRFFQFLDGGVRPDNMLVAIALQESAEFAVLSSRLHVHWAINAGGWLGVGNDPRYSKTRTFDPFPFPLDGDGLGELGDRLDTHRKAQIEKYPKLTVTALYNVLERVRLLDAGADAAPLTEAEREIYEAGLVGVLADLHDEIDRAVLDAYGWGDLAGDLVGKPGGTCVSAHKSPAQEEAEAELLTRLVALNTERAKAERRGEVHWLRPDYQKALFGKRAAEAAAAEQIEADLAAAVSETKPKWPKDGLDQIAVVRDILVRSPRPLPAEQIAAAFAGRATQKRKDRLGQVLETLVAAGVARARPEDAGNSYFVPG